MTVADCTVAKIVKRMHLINTYAINDAGSLAVTGTSVDRESAGINSRFT